jgi:hypothetical protein
MSPELERRLIVLHEIETIDGYVNVSGFQIFYNSFSSLNSKGTLVCLHGGPGSTHESMLPLAKLVSYWAEARKAIDEDGADVIVTCGERKILEYLRANLEAPFHDCKTD